MRLTKACAAAVVVVYAAVIVTSAAAATPPRIGMTVSGRVELRDGKPAANHRVSAVCDAPSGTYAVRSKPTGADGTFELHDVPDGACRLGVLLPDGRTCFAADDDDYEGTELPCTGMSKQIEVRAGVNVRDVVLIAEVLDPVVHEFRPTTLEGTVVNAEGRPLLKHGVAASCTRPDNATFDTQASPGDGSFILEIEAPSDTVCLLRPWPCRSMEDCEPPPCEGANKSKCIAVQLKEGATTAGIVLHPLPPQAPEWHPFVPPPDDGR